MKVAHSYIEILMLRTFVVLLCFSLPLSAIAAENSYKAIYDGGSLSLGIKSGSKADFSVDSFQIKLSGQKETYVTIAPASVTEVSYGQDVHRRIGTAIGLAVISLGIGALLMFSKSKKHYIGLTPGRSYCFSSTSVAPCPPSL